MLFFKFGFYNTWPALLKLIKKKNLKPFTIHKHKQQDEQKVISEIVDLLKTQ